MFVFLMKYSAYLENYFQFDGIHMPNTNPVPVPAPHLMDIPSVKVWFNWVGTVLCGDIVFDSSIMAYRDEDSIWTKFNPHNKNSKFLYMYVYCQKILSLSLNVINVSKTTSPPTCSDMITSHCSTWSSALIGGLPSSPRCVRGTPSLSLKQKGKIYWV